MADDLCVRYVKFGRRQSPLAILVAVEVTTINTHDIFTPSLYSTLETTHNKKRHPYFGLWWTIDIAAHETGFTGLQHCCVQRRMHD